LPRVPIDRSQIQQVLLNLTSNAIQAILSGSADRSARDHRPDGDRGSTDGRPSGSPSPTTVPGRRLDRTKLFVPFFTTKAPGEELGSGLPVSFDIVRRHEGRLRVRAGAGWARRPVGHRPADGRAATRDGLDGATRPAAKVASPASPRRQTRTAANGAGSNGGSGVVPARRPRALVLDDEESIRTFLRKALVAAGFDAVVVADGVTAVSEVRSAPIDVALVDHSDGGDDRDRRVRRRGRGSSRASPSAGSS
jgi:CheY-like chemotaxis protein